MSAGDVVHQVKELAPSLEPTQRKKRVNSQKLSFNLHMHTSYGTLVHTFTQTRNVKMFLKYPL